MLKFATLALTAAAAAFVAWYYWNGQTLPFAVPGFSMAELAVMAIAAIAGLAAVLALRHSMRTIARLERTIQGLETFENDVARRMRALEARVADEAPAPRPQSAAAPPLSAGPDVSADPQAAEPAPPVIPSKNQGLPLSQIAGLIRRDRIAGWYQPIVALPERVTRFLECRPFLLPEDGPPLADDQWFEQVRDELGAAVAARMVAASIRLVRRLKRSAGECSVVVALPAAALRRGRDAAEVEGQLIANAGIAHGLVLLVSRDDWYALTDAERDRLNRYHKAGYRLAISGIDDFAAPEPAVDGGLFSLLFLQSKQLLSGGLAEGNRAARLRALQSGLGIDIVATGLANEEAAMEMIDQDVLLAQGPIFSEPRPLRDAESIPISVPATDHR